MAVSTGTGQVIVWDRGRPARNGREARKRIKRQTCALRRGAGGTPALPETHLSDLTKRSCLCFVIRD